MPPKNQKIQTPQGLYTQAVEKPETKIAPKVSTFVTLTRRFSKSFAGMGKNAKFNEAEADAFEFLGYGITSEQYYGTYRGILQYGILLGLVLFALLFVLLPNLDETLKFGIGGVFLLIPVLFAYVYKGMPFSDVENEKIQALAYVPEIVNYLTMSMRLTPNLEKAVQFAANHGQGKIAEDLKKIVWDAQLGRYESVEEGLDELAYRWGAYNEDFKHALMLIRASILEADKERRFALLEKASQDVLEGTREKMDLYARKLQQPTVYLYYFGILLPLLMAILLPIGSSLTNNSDLAKAEIMMLAYNVVIPLMVFIYGKSIISNKPPTTQPPKIGKDFPGLPPRGMVNIGKTAIPFRIFALFVVVGLVFLGYQTDIGTTQDVLNNALYLPLMNAFSGIIGSTTPADPLKIQGTLGSIPSYLVSANERQDKVLDQIAELTGTKPRNEGLAIEVKKLPHLRIAAQNGFYVGQFTIFGLLLGAAISLSVYLLGEFGPRKKMQDDIRAMEGEFKDAMYVLASRMGENKPIEEALRSAVVFLPKSVIGKTVFRRVLENITTLGMTLDAALFDRTFGALRNVPSQIIRSGMQFLSDSVELGVDVASKSLIALSLQLRNAEKINDSLRKLLEDVTVMLKTMSTFVAPVVLGVVSAMQRLIVSSIQSQSSGVEAGVAGGVGGSSVASLGSTGGLGNLFNSKALATSAEPGAFVLILGIYLIEIVCLLTYFNAQIEDTNNELHTYTSIAKTLPLATALFCITVYFTGTFFSGGS